MNLFPRNQEVSLSIKSLYDSQKELSSSVKSLYDSRKKLEHCTVVYTHDEYEGVIADCYDLYNENGELACVDGETCCVSKAGETSITFRNDNGDYAIYFTLTLEEVGIADFNNTIKELNYHTRVDQPVGQNIRDSNGNTIGYSVEAEAQMDSYKVGILKKMLEYEESKTWEHYGATLQHWHGNINPITIDAGGLRCLIDYYLIHETKL